MPLARHLLLACLLLLLLALPGPAAAAPVVSGEFSVSDQPQRLTRGSDGNVWVILAGNKLARITPAGAVTEFDPPDLTAGVGITSGPDGDLWITEAMNVIEIPPGNPLADTKHPVPDLTTAQGITTGPDGNLWAGTVDKVVRIPPANPAAAQDFPVLTLDARGITAGGDGRLWVASFNTPAVFRVTTAGAFTSFPADGGLQEIARGPGSQVAYTKQNAAPYQVGLITPGTQHQKVNLANKEPFGITFGTDGAYWVPLFTASQLGRVTPTGGLTFLNGLSANSGPRFITAGANNTLWVSLQNTNKVARVTGVTPPAAPRPTGTTSNPVISSLRLSRRTFRRGRRLPALRSAVRTGTTVRFRLSENARVTFRFERRVVGRRVGRLCRRRTRGNSRSKRCVRYARVRGSFGVDGRQGVNRVRFQGRISRRRYLPLGRYRMVLRASDNVGNLSTRKRARFRLLAARKRAARR